MCFISIYNRERIGVFNNCRCVKVFKNALVPFRRSGMWTTAKVILRISLVRDAGEISGGFLYKMIILQLMLKFLESPEFPAKESTGIEMLKKVH